MREVRRLDRRMFLAELGRGTVAVAILGAGVVACSDDDDAGAATTAATTATTTAVSTTTATTAAPPTSAVDPSTTAPAAGGAVTWERISLGFVSAYVLARGGEAAVVDTGVAGSAPLIEDGLTAVGLGWDGVGHVILTHLHPDHIGSLGEVLGVATEAVGYAGEADIAGISSPRPLTPVGDGNEVFGLQIIATPGHTAGHICVLDPLGGLLVAGDALNGEAGGVVGPNPQFSSDMSAANASVEKLATFDYDTVVFGHGDPVEGDAAAQVAALVAAL